VVSFTLPSGWAILTSSVRALHSTGTWLDPSMAWGPLSNVTVTGAIWAQVATAAAAWIVFPVAAGSARVLRRAISC
jgi:ABC-2 type transport system permease protein